MKRIAALLISSFSCLAAGKYCQPIVIQHNQAPNSDQADYVLTVNDTDAHLATVSNGGYTRNWNGNDIIFSSDSAGQHLLSWDPLELYNPVTGQIVTHVAVGTISHTADTTIYRCAGTSYTGFQGGAAGPVWPSVYKLVEHFGNNGSVDPTDFSTFANQAVAPDAVPVAGIIGGAAGLNGSSAYVSASNAPSLQVTGSLSISGWVKFNARPAGFTEIIHKGSAYFLFADGNPYIGLAINGDYNSAANVFFPNSALGAWSYLAATYNGSTSEVRIYWNGVLVSMRTTSNILTTGIEPLALGAQSGGGGQFLNGAIDEFRIAEAVFSSDRITTEYNNQSSPGTFYLAGSWAPIQTTVNAGSQTLVF